MKRSDFSYTPSQSSSSSGHSSILHYNTPEENRRIQKSLIAAESKYKSNYSDNPNNYSSLSATNDDLNNPSNPNSPDNPNNPNNANNIHRRHKRHRIELWIAVLTLLVAIAGVFVTWKGSQQKPNSTQNNRTEKVYQKSPKPKVKTIIKREKPNNDNNNQKMNQLRQEANQANQKAQQASDSAKQEVHGLHQQAKQGTLSDTLRNKLRQAKEKLSGYEQDPNYKPTPNNPTGDGNTSGKSVRNTTASRNNN